MKITVTTEDLHLRHEWTISKALETGGRKISRNVFVKIEHPSGLIGLGEASPPGRYGENVESVEQFLRSVDPEGLPIVAPEDTFDYLESKASGQRSAKAAMEMAVWDLAGKMERQSVHDLVGIPFYSEKYMTSFSIGLDTPEKVAQKVLSALSFPILKIKLGSPDDRAIMKAVLPLTGNRILRIDANEAWKTKEEALKNIEWLSGLKVIEFIEQPMPAHMAHKDMEWLKKRSPLPLIADESFYDLNDLSTCRDRFHGINIKLVKTGGIAPAAMAAKKAREAGLKVMLGCMIESSISITAAAHLAELADYLDLDGNLLVNDDPYCGVLCDKGIMSLSKVDAEWGLGVKRQEHGSHCTS
ncbi:MAG: dipeptide epimerase [Verrucomicrobiota bacterium]|mgnify:CR=1 FL=1|nr:dipeptide epimerase [Verrucomicrobiota bacterium]